MNWLYDAKKAIANHCNIIFPLKCVDFAKRIIFGTLHNIYR